VPPACSSWPGNNRQEETNMSSDEIKKGGSFLIEDTGPQEIFTPEDFSEEQKMFAKTAEDFVFGEVIPALDKTEAQEEGAMVSLLKKSGELGLLMVDVPEKYGGLGLDKATSMLVTEVPGVVRPASGRCPSCSSATKNRSSTTCPAWRRPKPSAVTR
jgi:hypothetical protein